MVEIVCQAANLTRIFAKFSQTQAPFVEVRRLGNDEISRAGNRRPSGGLGGEVIGRTRPNEGGNKKPRWDGPVISVDPTRGGVLLFRVLISGVWGENLCGEGTVELKSLPRQANPCTVQLQRKGEPTGFLLFAFSLSTPAGQVTDVVGAPSSGSQATDMARALPPGEKGAANGFDTPVGAGTACAWPRQREGPQQSPKPGETLPPPWECTIDTKSGRQFYFNPATGQSQWERPGREGAHAGVPHPFGPGLTPLSDSAGLARTATTQGSPDQRLQPGESPQNPLPTNQYRAGASSSACGPTQGSPDPRLQPGGYPPNLQPTNQYRERTSTGFSASSSACEPNSPIRGGTPAVGAVVPDSPTSQLSMKDQGKQEAASIMQSKDKLRHYAERPFRRPEMAGRSKLSLNEFRAAVRDFMAELHIDNGPDDQQIGQMFAKFGDSSQTPGSVGVSREDFEAMLFRMLTFMLARGDVSVNPEQACTGEERDKRWREEFLQKNRRRYAEVYDTGKKLGAGTFGSVYEVIHKTSVGSGGVPVVRVCKVISKAQAEKVKTPHARIREEFAVLKRLDHPHVARIFEDFEDERCFFVIMEPCRGGDLQERVKNPHTRDAREWEHWVAKVMQHTLSAIAYCHGNGIIHKDLKPENVMMSSPREAPTQDLHVVVVDFGLAQMFSDGTHKLTEVAGTPPFMAPEVWAGSFGKGCDVWSCGVMLFFMLSGTYPFMAARVEDFPKAVATEPEWRCISGASSEANMICWRMLCKKETDRPVASDLLQDRWFAGQGLSGRPCNNVRDVGMAARGLLQVRERSSFDRFVARLVATQLDAGKLKSVNEAFRAFDADKDGALSRDELLKGLQMLGSSREEAQETINGLDVGKTGRISYTEFLAGVLDLRNMSTKDRDQRLALVWQQFSPDKNGMVSIGSVQAALAARGLTVAEMPRAFLQQLRRGSSKTMSFEDFLSLFQGDESCCIMSSFVGT